MKFGLFGSAQAQRGGADLDSGQGFKDYIEYNVEAEALGYDSTFVVEHHFTGFGQVSASLNLLTWVAAKTRTLRLGTAVIVLPWHNPVLLAEQAATVDLLSGGRLDFGVGKGYRHNEFVGFRIPMEEAEARFEESIEIITASTGSSTTSWSSRRPRSGRIRRSGRARAIPTRSARSPGAATTCCSTSSPRSRRRASASRPTRTRWRNSVLRSIRPRSALRARSSSPAPRTRRKPRSIGASPPSAACTRSRSARTAT